MELYGSFQTIHLRHLQVHQDHLGAASFDGAQRLPATLRGGHNFKNGITFKKRTERVQKCGRIVDRQHPNVLRCY